MYYLAFSVSAVGAALKIAALGFAIELLVDHLKRVGSWSVPCWFMHKLLRFVTCFAHVHSRETPSDKF
jgi:hypothetical protein